MKVKSHTRKRSKMKLIFISFDYFLSLSNKYLNNNYGWRLTFKLNTKNRVDKRKKLELAKKLYVIYEYVLSWFK